jgi:KaiC/GvpD/RAD55 family RecA-like ATPase
LVLAVEEVRMGEKVAGVRVVSEAEGVRAQAAAVAMALEDSETAVEAAQAYRTKGMPSKRKYDNACQ